MRSNIKDYKFAKSRLTLKQIKSNIRLVNSSLFLELELVLEISIRYFFDNLGRLSFWY